MLKLFVNVAIALLIGSAGGAIFALLGLPLPWTLGALTASAIAALSLRKWPMPVPVRNMARPVVGVLAGSAFGPQTWALVGLWWPAIVTVLLLSILISAIGYFFFTRLARFDPTTSYFAATPGGLGELSLLGEALGGSARTIALIHSVRIVAVVFAVPIVLPFLLGHDIQRDGAVAGGGDPSNLIDLALLFLAGAVGYAIGRYTSFPGGELVAAMLCSAAIHLTGLTSAAPPVALVILAQILIGSVTGARFAGTTLRELRTTVLIAIVWSVFLLIATAGVATLAAWFMEMDLAPVVLALAPGGTAEMIIITYALGADVAFVSICQICRIFLILTFTPIVHKRFIQSASLPARREE